MLRRGLALLIVLTLSVSIFLGACAQKATETSPPVAEPTKAPEEPPPTEEVAPTEIEVVEPKIFKIGLITALTGGGAIYGIEIQQGAQLAIDELNAAGGVGGYEFELLTEDHQIDPDKAVSAARKLISIDGVHMILSTFGSPTLAVQPITSELGIFTINAASSSDALLGLPGLFNTTSNRKYTVPYYIRWILENSGAEKIGTIFWSDTAGRGTNDLLKEECEKLGCEIVVEEPAEVGETDFSTQAARVKAADPEIVIVAVWGDDLGYMMRELHSIGLNKPVYGVTDFSKNALEIGGMEAVEGYTFFARLYDPEEDPEAGQFADAFYEAYGVEATFFPADQWEALKFVLAPLVEKVVQEGGDPTEPGTLSDAMEEWIAEKHLYETVYGPNMRMLPDHTCLKTDGIYAVSNGEGVIIGKLTPSE
jgi:branched-chain amino acid transport system substrate-binding protein